MRLLIVDDAEIERAILARIARNLGHEVVAEAVDLPSAVDLLERLAPDVVIVDGRLPPDGCLPALSVLRAAAPGAMLAIVATVSEIDLVRAAIASGADAALRRPLLQSGVALVLQEIGVNR